MNLELIAIVLGTVFQLISLAVAATLLAFRMGNFEGRVDTKLSSIDETSQEMSVKLGRLDETDGGGFARCTRHNDQIQELERRQTEQMEEMNRRWDAFQERVGSTES